MEKSRIKIFTSATCPHCPGALKLVREIAKERKDIILEELNTSFMEGSRKADMYGIQTVPTVLVNGPLLDKTLIVDPLTEKSLMKAIDVTQGKRKIQEKKSFSERLKEIF